MEPEARAALAERCGAALRGGGLVVIPTDTVYGLAASVEGLNKLRAAILSKASTWTDDGEPEFTWHAPDVAALTEAVALPTAVHRQLVRRLLPGPYRLVLDLDARNSKQLAATHGPLLSSGGSVSRLAVRVPASGAARGVLAAAGVPVVAVDLSLADFVRADAARTGMDDLSDAAAEAGVEHAVADGPTPGGSRSTTIRLSVTGAFTVDPAGGEAESRVLSALRRRVLFVCTGNTCRSPMAAAIARSLLADRPEDGVSLEIESAGVAAGRGHGATAEAVEAASRLGGDLKAHRSQGVTREMLRDADVIFTMTRGHLEALRSIDPRAADRASTLDPDDDVPDPIGGPISTYISTAERIADLIRARLQEIEP